MPPESDSLAGREKPGEDTLDTIHDLLDANFSANALSEIQPVFNGVRSIEQTGRRVAVTLDKPGVVPLDGEFLNGKIKLKSVKLDNVSFDSIPEQGKATNIDGVAINMEVFGTPFSLAVKEVHLTVNERGQRVLVTDVDNPLPEPAQRIIGMPDEISIEIPVRSDGLTTPLLSQVFQDAASSTGKSLPGLLAADALNEASNVSRFVESNPQWVDDVVEPAVNEIYDKLVIRGLGGFTPAQTQQPMSTISPPRDAPKHATTSDSAVRQSSAVPQASTSSMTPISEVFDSGGDSNRSNLKPTEIPRTGDFPKSVEIKGVERNYRVHVPPSYNGQTPMPLVLVLHGIDQDGDTIARVTDMDSLADREGFIVVYPDARSWAGIDRYRIWDTDNGLMPPGSDADDVSFLRTVIEQAENEFKIDDKRIYMAGLSNGGMMTFRAAGELSDKLAAVAIVSGAMSGSEPPPDQPLSVLNIHGTADRIVPYYGLKNVPSSLTAIGLPKFKPMEYTTNYWTEQNQIEDPPIVLNNGNVRERRFINPETGVEVNEYTIFGGRHVPADIEGVTDDIWSFFESHPKSDGTTSGTPHEKQEEPFNLTERIRAHANTRGIKGLEHDVAAALNEVTFLPNGSFSPSATLAAFERESGLVLDDGVSSFLKSTLEVEKQDTRIDIDLEQPQEILVKNGGAGPVRLTSVTVNDMSFELHSRNGRPTIGNLNGVSVNITALGSKMSVDVREVSQKLDGNGDPFYRVKTENPISPVMRMVMLGSSEIPVNLQLNANGRPTLLNQREIKDATLGYNPVTRGFIDAGSHVADFYNRPSLTSGLNVGKDIALIGGSSYGSYRLASKLGFARKGKIGMVLTAGVILAPSIIHGIERLVD